AAWRRPRRGAAIAASIVGGRHGEPRRRRRSVPGGQALALAGTAAARGVAGRHGAGRARALRALVGRVAAVALHARRGSRWTRRDRGRSGTGWTLDQQ